MMSGHHPLRGVSRLFRARHRGQITRYKSQQENQYCGLTGWRRLQFHHHNFPASINSGKQGADIISSPTKQFLRTSSSSISPRQLAVIESKILNGCALVNDPILDVPLKQLGWLKSIDISSDGLLLTIHMKLPTLLHPDLDILKRNIELQAMQVCAENSKVLSMVEKVYVDISAGLNTNVSIRNNISEEESSSPSTVTSDNNVNDQLGPGLANVAQFLAVYSCKGGVGKSTIAANLAYALAHQGGRVGLLDVDVYGPSLPVIVRPDDATVRRSPLGKSMVMPIEHAGVKMLSLGFVSPTSGAPGGGLAGGAAVMRGPLAGRVVSQLLKGTDWGQLDVLVLDMPPGTGDIQLQLCQDIQLSGAVVITTPSKLAVADAVKGVEMFTSLGVPTLTAVENMSFFECEGGGRHYPFGKGGKQIFQQLGEHLETNAFQMPISPALNNANDIGVPLMISRPENASLEVKTYDEIAKATARALFSLRKHQTGERNMTINIDDEEWEINLNSLSLGIDASENALVVRLFSEKSAKQILVKDLRSRDPKTGEILLNLSDESEAKQKSSLIGSCGGEIHVTRHQHSHNDRKEIPTSVSRKGNYGYAVEWGDDATIIYSFYSLAKAAELSM